MIPSDAVPEALPTTNLHFTRFARTRKKNMLIERNAFQKFINTAREMWHVAKDLMRNWRVDRERKRQDLPPASPTEEGRALPKPHMTSPTSHDFNIDNYMKRLTRARFVEIVGAHLAAHFTEVQPNCWLDEVALIFDEITRELLGITNPDLEQEIFAWVARQEFDLDDLTKARDFGNRHEIPWFTFRRPDLEKVGVGDVLAFIPFPVAESKGLPHKEMVRLVEKIVVDHHLPKGFFTFGTATAQVALALAYESATHHGERVPRTWSITTSRLTSFLWWAPRYMKVVFAPEPENLWAGWCSSTEHDSRYGACCVYLVMHLRAHAPEPSKP
jgi:hypothetical protein